MADLMSQALKYLSREDEENLSKKLADKYKMPYVNLMSYPVVPDVLHIIPEDLAEKNGLVAYMRAGKIIKIATPNPANQEITKVISQLEESTELNFSLSVCSQSSYRYIMHLYKLYPTQQSRGERVEVSEEMEEKYKSDIKNLVDLKEKIKKVSATELMDIIFAGAVATNSSDIHLEPEENDLKVRYRIDGVLQTVADLPQEAYKTINSRIKYLAKLKLDITSKPQDGRFEVEAAGKPFDIRVSTLPSAFGETIVMRLLSREGKFITLKELGFSPDHIRVIEEAIRKPNGIIFNTGPTGSGKTTTLYAILTELNKPGVKIITMEDPIEYRIPGINQSQVEPEKGYTFATGLRSALRQDPDILLVGEIRDQETAEIAVHSALTGHLVITTLHTNNAPSALPRLLDMGVAPYLLAGTVNLIIAQRLVRKLCHACGGKGCALCNNLGYKGRIAIAEVIVPSKEIEDLIAKKGTVREFEDAAKRAGMISMYEDGMKKVQEGLTTKEEVERVVQE